MQCVILVAGEGTRMRPFTEKIPKPLIKIAEKSILDHIIDALPDEITELVLVVGYRQEQIRKHCGDMYKGRTVTYVIQPDPKGGTGDALIYTKDVLRGKFLLLNGDDIYGESMLKYAVSCDNMIFGYYSETPERFGVLVPNPDGTLKAIIEKPKNPQSNHINIGGYVLNDAIFNYNVPLSAMGELYVTDMVTEYAKDTPVQIVEQDLWIPVGYPDDIEKAEKILRELRDK